ncbi:2-phosphosulfolactate phosphatase [Rhodohalobacter mucosus]|uniref:Probable 2-phosphosulfolactate phosphatase n=1 Tax=Rhodohalobacter mucosus TaxID=2079485 RepID=A0A316TVH2_9BACT|nr:2-phosphosulfolactate phosphatase [Rhodohalobacter mucosus]PWN07928.1 2-phosphosulfolactate phosphatase [Rhodohalobacter mucosus]
MIQARSIDVFFSAQSFQENDLRNKTVVVIDVLRATSTMVTALMNGARGVIPVGDMGEASKISQNLDSENHLLCGEKDGVKIEGYDLGNSPLEYTREHVEGKTLIFNTTNGTKAVKKSMGASNVMIGAFLNLTAVSRYLESSQNDVILLCAGWKGRLALEDTLLAGAIIYKLYGGSLPDTAPDGAKVAFGLFEKYRDDIESVILQSNHAVRLADIVENNDVSYCCKIDLCDIVPVLTDGIIS